METRVQRIYPERLQDSELQEAMQEAGEILRQGGLVAFPTETVYGLGADAMNPKAAERIYEAKGRPSDNPLIVHIADIRALSDLAENVPDQAIALAEVFWPGPLTIILRKKETVPMSTTGGLNTVAVRMPSHPAARALIRESGVCIAAPSANLSGRPSPTRAEHVVEDLDGRIEMVIDGGHVGIGLESTIIDLSAGEPVILRPGYITRENLEQVIGRVTVDEAVTCQTEKTDIVARAPGMKYRHYAPKGQMRIVQGEREKVIAAINEMVGQQTAAGYRTAVIATEESKERYQCELVRSIGSRQTEGSVAAGLYDILREMDHLGAEYIFAESFEKDPLGDAIMNRLCKAAGYHILQV